MSVPLKQRILRRATRMVLAPMLRWKPLRTAQAGYSIILGVPWDLRHLLPVNLKFVSRTDLSELRRIHIVFDRTPQAGAEEMLAAIKVQFPDMPLAFHFYPALSGRIIERISVSTWFNSMNCVTALKAIDTQYAVLHDFDLYPLTPNYFREIVKGLRDRRLHFCGLERTFFDGLTADDNLLGTWCLGMDVDWIRNNHRPIEVFQRVVRFPDGRCIQLDPFSYLQTLTPKRQLVGTIDENDACHVRNLCGTYMRYKGGRKPDFVWRLHYMWYLESLCGLEHRLGEVITAMRNTDSGLLRVGGFETDFSRTHVTCANVLRKELTRMEEALFGACREEVRDYLDAFEAFLKCQGDSTPIERFVKVSN